MVEFVLPHIDISSRKILRRYKGSKTGGNNDKNPRDRASHGARLSSQLGSVLRATDASRPDVDGITERNGYFVEVEVVRGNQPEKLERKSKKIQTGATTILSNENANVVLYIPEDAQEWFQAALNDYTSGALTEAGHPQKRDLIEPIEEIRQAQLQSFWTDDPGTLPSLAGESIWWELWCHPGTEYDVSGLVTRLGGQIADRGYWLEFPEAHVVPVYTSRSTIELLLFGPFGLLELRRASATPAFFTESSGQDQFEWTNNLAERVTWPASDVPVVCLLDTGVNRAHPLIEPALSPNDMLTVREEWGTDDHNSHGTKMAGLLLHGDLTPKLLDESKYVLDHRIESVKLLPPSGFPSTDPRSYGSITQAAVARSEINSPDRRRVFCMAITNENISGERPSTWSAAIDQIAAGVTPGDDQESPKRLFIMSSGNVDIDTDLNNLLPSENYPCEEPCQAWNALAVGGFTDKQDVTDEGYEDYRAYVEVGGVSLHSRTSEKWASSKSPYKPDVVMEAGNHAVSPDNKELIEADSLSVLTTGANVDFRPLKEFGATSAAAAQAARLAVRLSVAHPNYWPETIRALIVHSAEWTAPMKKQIDERPSLRDRYDLLRRFGYGVPSYERALASSQSNLALVAQNTIQPFNKSNKGREFGHCHFYKLPWPKEDLEKLNNTQIRLKVTLSYFVEPNPGFSGSINPQRYQSHGLRFELRRSDEDNETFVRRVNAFELDEGEKAPLTVAEDGGWTFGTNSIAAGSLHCDEWVGPAVNLANRDMLCVKPVMGWWRKRSSIDICNRESRYALILTISTPDESVELYSKIEYEIAAEVGVENIIMNK